MKCAMYVGKLTSTWKSLSDRERGLDQPRRTIYKQYMGSLTNLTSKLMHLPPWKVKALEQLSAEFGRKQSELMREGIYLLLEKYKMMVRKPSK